MRAPSRILRGAVRPILLLAVPAFPLLALPLPLDGQVRRTVGIHVGETRSHQVWSGPISSRTANGLSLGVNVDVPTPAEFLSIRVGLGYVRRGSEVWDENLDPNGAAPANIRSHYLSVPVQGKVRWRFGPGTVYLFAGPAVDQLLETGCDQDLCRVLREELPTVLSVTAGSGVSVDFGDRFRVELEVQLAEGLTEAYRADSSSIRYRTVEILLRAGFPF